MRIPESLFQSQKSPILFLVSGELESRFYVIKNGIISMRGDVAFSLPEKVPEHHNVTGVGIFNLHKQDVRREFYQQTVAQMREIISEEKISHIHIFAPHHIAFAIFSLFSSAEKAILEDILFGEYLKMHPLGLTRELKTEHVKTI